MKLLLNSLWYRVPEDRPTGLGLNQSFSGLKIVFTWLGQSLNISRSVYLSLKWDKNNYVERYLSGLEIFPLPLPPASGVSLAVAASLLCIQLWLGGSKPWVLVTPPSPFVPFCPGLSRDSNDFLLLLNSGSAHYPLWLLRKLQNKSLVLNSLS